MQKTDLEKKKMKKKKKALQGKFQLGTDHLFYLLIRGLSMAMLSVLHFLFEVFCLS